MKYSFVFLVVLCIGTGLLSLFFINDLSLLLPEGHIADRERDLILISFGLTMIVVVPVLILTPVIAWQYRASNTKARYQPNRDTNPYLETVWWGVPCVIIAVLAVITWNSTHELDPFRPLESTTEPVEIQVIALNWKWLFLYPEYGIASVNVLHVPEKRPLNFTITSDAPMNSFWIPRLGGQIYAMTGMSSKLHLIADRVGVYQGASANFSGKGFSGMKFETHAVSDKDFDAYVEETRALGSALSYAEYGELARPSENVAPRSFVLTEPDLYHAVLMKYMPRSSTVGNVRSYMDTHHE